VSTIGIRLYLIKRAKKTAKKLKFLVVPQLETGVFMKTKGPNLRQILAMNIKEQRRILGVSQEKLAEMAGLSWQTVNSIECQRTWVSDNTLEALAGAFKIETFQLLMPSETRAALSLNSTKALRNLAAAKKAYDDTFAEIYSTMT
jgi:transcriptional regulator with XRE-family HTH domain